MKKLVLTALALSVLSTPVLAQKGKDNEPLAILEREKKQQAEQLDLQYKQQMERSRREGNTAAARNDPWANMRAPNDGKR